ncbi:hypothetical protein OHS33_32990 [Streptomyces sp. NBC_00536]|uniref:hypothetical protein n=1 Tax=Streptomyces sp. NBC_00536 TaxID=2975769 RepID=UPI002E807623|nr:hypothetical protein [Streptomyces sp. NBC_00536]WUC82758.1 hypothetical protein OHS33_32990 [Streptomyces sp. NBC_00536]
MIEFVFIALAAGGAGWLVRRRHLQRVTAASDTAPVGIPGMARLPAGHGRWRMGRVYGGPEAVRWVPARGEPAPLTGARSTGVRPPSVREGMVINPGSRILSCTYADGTADIAVMALDLAELHTLIPHAPEAAAQGGPESV